MAVQRSISVGSGKSNASNKDPLSAIYDKLVHIQQNTLKAVIYEALAKKPDRYNDPTFCIKCRISAFLDPPCKPDETKVRSTLRQTYVIKFSPSRAAPANT
jgi:hypothetical protein